MPSSVTSSWACATTTWAASRLISASSVSNAFARCASSTAAGAAPCRCTGSSLASRARRLCARK